MYKIQKLNPIATEGLSLLPLDKYEIGTEIANPDAMLLRSFKMHDIKLGDALLAVGRAGAGVNNIPIDKCSEQGVVVFNTPGANANAVKELAIASLLLASRDIVKGIAFSDSLKGKGDEVPGLVEKGKKNYGGVEIMGKTLAVVGLGKIGVMVANAAIDLGMKVIGYDPFISVESAWDLSRDIKRTTGLDTLMAEADFISLHTPLIDETKGLINTEKLSQAKKGVRIINLSRGGIVNNEDLIKGLKDGTVARYVTDFPDEELLGIENVIPIPHLGASTEEAENNCAIMVAKQIREFVEKGNIVNSVNFPECKMVRDSENRIIIINKNIPNMVGQISTILAESSINIIKMVNKSKGDYAYSMIDVEQVPDDKVMETLNNIEGVIKVRLLKIEE